MPNAHCRRASARSDHHRPRCAGNPVLRRSGNPKRLRPAALTTQQFFTAAPDQRTATARPPTFAVAETLCHFGPASGAPCRRQHRAECFGQRDLGAGHPGVRRRWRQWRWWQHHRQRAEQRPANHRQSHHPPAGQRFDHRSTAPICLIGCRPAPRTSRRWN